ncbi:hypothetical protein ACBY01_11730 [Sphingomonas sp. ac-8]|uniref:hypothetical protein n=1 Tax=Sphingomonas sp. ac-8 TaxID=3242977 RepID=UPI003A8024E8
MKPFVLVPAIAMTLASSMPAVAQQATNTRDTQRAYGSRLDRQAVPEVSSGVVQRQNSRIESRINNRLNTRIERYAVAVDPAASLRTRADDGTRRSTIVQAPLPPPE